MAQVNPKDMKPQVYKDPRPAEMFTQYHRSARKGVGWIYDFVRMILTLPTILFYRARAIGVAFALLAIRSRVEETQLAARFGDAYRDYQRRTGRFLPRWRS